VPTVLRALLLSALLTLLPVAIGVAVSGDETLARKPAAYRGIPLAEFDSTKAVVQRAPFCDLVPEAAVREALGEEATVTAYDNGEQSDAVPGGDVAHEYGCRYSPAAADGVGQARGWVFAPPVTVEAAQRIADTAATGGCTPLPDVPAYGEPSVAVTCPGEGVQTVSFRGLFGDAWLSCSLTRPTTVPVDELVDRAGRWCVAVAQAASVPLT